MKHALLSSASILAITAVPLFSAVAVADDGAADNVAEECRLTINSTDQMQYDKSELSVPASCETVSLTLTHSGSMTKDVMGHNWVLAPTDAYQ